MKTIKSSREIDVLFKEGMRISHPLVLALVRRTSVGADQDGRVAFIAGRRLGGAVTRNRVKRVLRHACARAGGSWPGADVLLVARRGLADASPTRVDEAMASIARGIKETE